MSNRDNKNEKGKLFERRGRKAIGTKLLWEQVGRVAVSSFGVCLFCVCSASIRGVRRGNTAEISGGDLR